MTTSPSDENNFAVLHWSSSSSDDDVNNRPCFCDPLIKLDVSKLQATPETLAAIYGILDPECITILDKETKQVIPLETVDGNEDNTIWNLKAKQDYLVQISTTSTTTTNNAVGAVVPINKIFTILPGKTENDKDKRLHNLSNNFYDKIWHDPNTPKEFHDKFYSRTASSEIQAFRQYNWLIEAFGGPSLQAGDLSFLYSRVMIKHTANRMKLEYAITWLQLMKCSIEEEFPDEPDLKLALGLYWLHFYAFFPYTDDERREFRKLIS